jgi:hypothetical protein
MSNKSSNSSEFSRQLVVSYNTYQASKPNKVASLPEVAPLLLLPVSLHRALALYMKNKKNYVSKEKQCCLPPKLTGS